MTPSLLDRMNARRGHFAFESGFHGDLLLDLDGFFERPRDIAPSIDGVTDQVRALDADVICGPFTGGALLAYRIAEKLGRDYLSSERVEPPASDGLFPYRYRLVGAPDRVRHRRVVVVDDVINAGSATGATLNALLDHGAMPAGIAALLALGDAPAEMAAAFGVPLVATAHEQVSLWEPSACPLCAQGCTLG